MKRLVGKRRRGRGRRLIGKIQSRLNAKVGMYIIIWLKFTNLEKKNTRNSAIISITT